MLNNSSVKYKLQDDLSDVNANSKKYANIVQVGTIPESLHKLKVIVSWEHALFRRNGQVDIDSFFQKLSI